MITQDFKHLRIIYKPMSLNNIIFQRLFILFLSSTLFSCVQEAGTDFFRNSDFNAQWQFHLGDVSDPFVTDIDNSEWIPVHLPHDWSILDYKVQDSLYQGPFFKNLPGGKDVGYLRDGIAWYRKEFTTQLNAEGRQFVLSFDGVQTQMELWVNGKLIGEHVYGYTPFQFDIAPALKSPGQKNVIAVKTINRGENSRWFAGAGIYRPVTLSLLQPVSIAPWGLFVSTPEVSTEKAIVNLEIEVSNLQESEVELRAEIAIISPDDLQIMFSTELVTAKANSRTTLNVSESISNPHLWDVDQAQLYRLEVSLYADGQMTDSYNTSFGIRSISYSAVDGFLLNGKELLMKGACMHHDNGLLGAAAFPDAEYRRVKIMKENGYNAIRTSHNPPSESFLRACDEIGVLVIDEAFDHWLKPKRPKDYSNYFKEWHIRDVQAMVYRDRNHPSVIMWSFGNEIQERADPDGIEIGRQLAKAIREVDDTRPVTQAVCDFWDNPGKEWDYTEGAFSMLDISGYNYQFLKYESDHKKFPQRIMYGSESVPQHAWENWEMVKRNKYVLGDFVWTGMDYIGESGIGHHFLVDMGAPEEWAALKDWPWYVAWCGDIDLLGNKKPQSYYRDILWGESNLEVLVSTPVPVGKESRLSYWGWFDELKSWNWAGYEDQELIVKVYSSYPEVRLELNGTEVALSKIDSLDKYVALFELPYEPGELKATGLRDGKEVESQVLQTAGPASQLVLIKEKTGISTDPNSLAFLKVEALDKQGIPVLSANSNLQVRVAGPATLLAAGNASPIHQGSFSDDTFNLFQGKALVIIRSTGEPGSISVEVLARGLDSGLVSLEAR
jgi:beta-galactosidase